MKLYSEIVRAFDDLVLVLDRAGVFRDAFNTEGKKLLMSVDNFIGRRFQEVLPPPLALKLHTAIEDAHRLGMQQVDFTYELNLEGEIHQFICTLVPVLTAELDGSLAIVRDISFECRQRESIRRKESLLAASATANEALLGTSDLVSAVSVGLQKLGVAADVSRCYLFQAVWNAEIQELVFNQLLEWNSGCAEPQIDNPLLQNTPASAFAGLLERLENGEPLATSVAELPDVPGRDILEMQGIISIILIPVMIEGHIWGFVGFDECTRERKWSNAEVSILHSFATSIAVAIQRKKTEDDLRHAKVAADAANQAKSAFLSNITHEIRTPLHGVIGYTEMLSGHDFPSPEREYFQNLRHSATLLYELINNILDFSRIEANVFEFHPENYVLADIVASARASVAHLALVSGNELVFEVASDVPKVIHIDPTRLKQVLVNLLSNALKFTSNGLVSFAIRVCGKELIFSVKDNGIGISGEQLAVICQPFTQIDSSITKKYQGSGLGLSIIRHIVGHMGSALRIESELGKGSEFSFALKLDDVAVIVPLVTTRDPQESSAGLPPIDVMVVEDSRLNMMLVETVLRNIGSQIQVHKAFNGMEAIQLIQHGLRPDVVFMDLQMPIIDGFETTRRIRSIVANHITVVALTASAISEIRERCIEVGMDDFLSKPFTKEQISATLRRCVQPELVSQGGSD